MKFLYELLPIANIIIADKVLSHFQNETIPKYLARGGEKYEWKKASTTIVLSIALTAIIYLTLFSGSVYIEIQTEKSKTVYKTYGSAEGNTIVYFKDEISQREADKIAEVLTQQKLPYPYAGKQIKLKKTADSIEIVIPLDNFGKNMEKYSEIYTRFKNLKEKIQKEIPEKKLL